MKPCSRNLMAPRLANDRVYVDDRITVAPGSEHRLAALISVAPI